MDLCRGCGLTINLKSAATFAAPLPDRQWGTYVNSYTPHIQLDAAGNIDLVGSTIYPDNVATPGAHKAVPQDIEATLMKFDPAGERIWGTYFGGEALTRARPTRSCRHGAGMQPPRTRCSPVWTVHGAGTTAAIPAP